MSAKNVTQSQVDAAAADADAARTPGHKIRELLSTIGGGVAGGGLGAGLGYAGGAAARALGAKINPTTAALVGGIGGGALGMGTGSVIGGSHGQSDANLGRKYERYANLEQKMGSAEKTSAGNAEAARAAMKLHPAVTHALTGAAGLGLGHHLGQRKEQRGQDKNMRKDFGPGGLMLAVDRATGRPMEYAGPIKTVSAELDVVQGAFLDELAKIAADLTEEARNHIAKKNFAVSAKASNTGKPAYPIENKAHAKAALGLAAMHGDQKDIAEVRKDVEKKYPGMVHEKKASFSPRMMRAAALELASLVLNG